VFKAIYITEAGKKVGFGHLKRSVSLSALLPNCEIHVVLEQSLSMDWIHGYKTWDSSSSVSVLLDQYDVVIFDSFHGSQQTYIDLQRHPCVIYIDDYVRRPLKTGLVVDWTVGAEHREPMGDAHCYGVRYLVTRPQFHEPKLTSHRKKITDVTTVFGGSDPFNMSSETARLLRNESNLNVRHLGTKLYPSYPEFKNDERFYWDLDDDDFANYLASSDVVITAGGQTLYELASLGIPAIAVSVAANQDDDINGFNSLGTCRVLDAKSINTIVSFLENISLEDRQCMSRASKGVDGRGFFLKAAIYEFINEHISI
jgi:spore coat polysaccharide biosynthesis predicted glycosyltransferase SpsG